MNELITTQQTPTKATAMTSPRVLMNAWNLRPRKNLGQNFLADRNTAEMIVARSAVSGNDTVLEIGSGLGALTIPLARQAKKVYAVEKDEKLVKLLKNELLTNSCHNVVPMQADIFRVDLKTIAATAGNDLFIMGNIPYNISSQILVQLILERKCLKKAVLMFQKELAMRIMAGPGGRSYGRIAVMLGYCAVIRQLATIQASLFFPKPKVDSVILEIVFQEAVQPPAIDEAFLFKVVKAAFSKRRKTLQNSLAGSILQISAKIAGQEVSAAGIDPVRRSETLSITEFVMLSNHLYNAGYR
jgi:16S rRNA (adenine1518-N6/adenine1519-N6)-dimethyltransferase